MSSLPAGLAAALSNATNTGGSWGDLAGELRLFMEAQQDTLDMSRLLNINLMNRADQMKAQLLAMPASRPSAGTRAPAEPKLSKIFSDPGNFDSSPGKKFEEWWTHVCSWQHENAAALPDRKAISTVLSHMVGGRASDFARSQLNAILRGVGETNWDDFSLLVEKHFQSTTKKDQNWLALWHLKQKGHPMEAFLLKFENYALLTDYDKTRQIEQLEQNADKEIITCLILEKGRYTFLDTFKANLRQAGARKQLLDFIQKGTAEWSSKKTLTPWTSMLSKQVVKINVSIASRMATSGKTAQNPNCNAPSATSPEVVTRKHAPSRAKERVKVTAARCVPHTLRNPQPPGKRIKAPTRTTREKVATGPLP